MAEVEFDPKLCPDCGKEGRYERRFTIGGRGVYSCECGTRWQDLDEEPTAKGTPIRAPRKRPHRG